MKLIDILNEALDFGVINEAGLSRLLGRLKNHDFAIVTGYKSFNSRAENRRNNGRIISSLNSKNMGGYMLIGHWQEAPEGVDYKNADVNTLVDTIEESILYIRPESMSQDEFIDFNLDICKSYKQDAVIVGLSEMKEASQRVSVFLYYRDGSRDKIGDHLTLGKISQAYSQMKNKPNVPFVFEGLLHPSNNIGKQVFKIKNILFDKGLQK